MDANEANWFNARYTILDWLCGSFGDFLSLPSNVNISNAKIVKDHFQHISMCVQLLTVHYKSCHRIIPALHGSFNEGSESSVVSDLHLCSREVIHDVVTYGDMTCVRKD